QLTNTRTKTGLNNEVRKVSFVDTKTEVKYPTKEIRNIAITNSTLFKTIPLLPEIFVFGKGIRLFK
ncbi:hypothetical protein ABTE84_20355, partial [Acinetobacter baumannii]